MNPQISRINNVAANAIYKKGFFYPLEPVFIKAKQRVSIIIFAENTLRKSDNNDYSNMDWLTLPSENADNVKTVTIKQRQKIAEIIGKKIRRPVSKMIIEDRG